MTRRNRNLILQFALATAVCGVIGFFGRPLIGMIGFGLCVAIFAIHVLSPGESRSIPDNAAGRDRLPGANHDDSSTARSERAPGCYNPDNPVLPIYYPSDRRN